MTKETLQPEDWALVYAVLEAFDGGDWPLAKRLWQETCYAWDQEGWGIKNEKILSCWDTFDSRQRPYLKDEYRKYLEDF